MCLIEDDEHTHEVGALLETRLLLEHRRLEHAAEHFLQLVPQMCHRGNGDACFRAEVAIEGSDSYAALVGDIGHFHAFDAVAQEHLRAYLDRVVYAFTAEILCRILVFHLTNLPFYGTI